MRKLETSFLIFAMMLAILLEAAFVYWLFEHGLVHVVPHKQLDTVSGWTGLALPQGWLLGALPVLCYRLALMIITPETWTPEEFTCNRWAFIRLWRWVIGLIAIQGVALFLARPVAL
jgi:hypothetical protein